MSDLTIYGNGALTVVGNFNDGIASKDGLIIISPFKAIAAITFLRRPARS